jgi:cell division septation protein DedD
MVRLTILLSLLALAGAAQLPAQTADTTGSDSVFLRAQRMVTEGQGDAGRALVEAELQAAPTGSPRYVEALYWRASLAATAADAERDYRKIIIEYPLTDRAGDALVRMGQLEMARGERDQAVEHFRRLVLEHPTHAQRARASYWMAQLLFQSGHAPRACASLADARRSAAGSDVELRNQIEYYEPRCIGVDTTAAQPPTIATAAGDGERPAPPAAAPAPATRATPPASSGATGWSVQVAAFRTQQSANRLRAGLAARGFPVRAVKVGSLWRVRVGRYATREAAEAARGRMRAGNVDGIVVEAEPR